jgi:hypothetical protein
MTKLYSFQLLAAMKERAKMAGIGDGTRSNILVNKKGANHTAKPF